MSRFVLVHGAWLGAWCWDAVAAVLRSHGHEAVAVELPGHGGDRTSIGSISLASYVERVAPAIDGSAQRSILIGHSMAGIVLSHVAEARPYRVSSLIYLAAYLLTNGQSIAEASALASDSLVGPNMVPAPDWSTIAIKPEALRQVFAADAPPAELERLQSLARPEPAAPFNTPVAVTKARFGSVPRYYIKTSQDRAVTPKLQDAMLANMPCVETVTMATSHTPFFAKPDELAGHFLKFATN
jgi:pimeloyl-ACP methyl ester carboxylesterase